MKVKAGDKIRVHYEGRLENGEIFDSSSHGDHSHPLEFVVGSSQMIKGFDDAVVGMELNEEKEIKIKPQEAYGEVSDEAIREVQRSIFGDHEVEEGMQIMLSSPDGHQFPAKVIAVDEKTVEVDLNHPLAGKTLIFKIKIIAINEEGDLSEYHH